MERWRGGERSPPDHHYRALPTSLPNGGGDAAVTRDGRELSEWMMRGEREAAGFKTPPLKWSSLKKGSFAATNKRAFLDS